MKIEEFKKIDSKFLQQRKFKNYELYKEYKNLRWLRRFYSYHNIEEELKKREKEKEEIEEKIKELKKKEEKEKKERPVKPKPIYKNELSEYQVKLYHIISELFDYLISKPNYAYYFSLDLLKELKIYIKDLLKYFSIEFDKAQNALMIQISNISRCIEIKEIIKSK